MKVHVLTKTFQDKTVLQDIEIDIEPGKTSVFLGPSGCGKSTLLNLISGLDPEFDGKIEKSPWKIGMVFQEPRLLPWLSVRDNIHLVNPDADVEQLAKAVGVETSVETLAAHLSVGMARRVAFLRALAIEPDLLIMDEPFVSLDQQRAYALREMVLDLIEQQKITGLFVTHDPEEAVQLGHTLFIMAGQPTQIKSKETINLSSAERRCPKTVRACVNTLFCKE